MTMTKSLSGPTTAAIFTATPPRWLRQSLAALLALALLALGYVWVSAQVSGDRGIAPTASSSDIEVGGIEIDVTGDSAVDARNKGWRQAQREAWVKAGGPAIAAAQVESMVSAIVIERERIGPKRYVATLGVVFDRQRAGKFLGGAAQKSSSAPMLLLPITASAGTYTTYEVRNPWQRAWAQFNPGRSRVDYVRASGAGGDSLVLNFGQATRRSRAWWRTTLDQYRAADALFAFARLEYQFPGGPITGKFVARHGPDSRFLEGFEMTANGPDDLADMLNKAVVKMDGIFSQAVAEGKLKVDPSLNAAAAAKADPAVLRLIEIGRALQRREADAAGREEPTETTEPTETPTGSVEPTPQPTAVTSSVTIQFATPDPMAFDASLSGVRGTPGVRGVAVTSTAMGGTSVMSVTFSGTPEQLAEALRSRGFRVSGGGSSLAISR